MLGKLACTHLSLRYERGYKNDYPDKLRDGIQWYALKRDGIMPTLLVRFTYSLTVLSKDTGTRGACLAAIAVQQVRLSMSHTLIRSS